MPRPRPTTRLREVAPAGELSPARYAEALEALRGRIRRAYEVGEDVAIMFAPSGTDLEYVALACTGGKAPKGTHNILLGADEVGSGCIYSAFGQYFAESTALGVATEAGQPVPGLGETHVEMIDIPVRDESGYGRRSSEIAAAVREAIGHASAAGRHPLVHVVHGSKTGLILPTLDDIDALRAEHDATFVVDACQARITAAAVGDYLERGAIVFVTGSKFMGGPPFSGFALVPAALAQGRQELPHGFTTLFRRAEWPAGWPGADRLPDTSHLAGRDWTFEDAQRWHKDLLAHDIRLGQPVKCVKLEDGRWGATLRIGLTMWQVVDRAGLDGHELAASFEADMKRVAAALKAVASDQP